MSADTILLVDDSRIARIAARNAISKLRPGAVFVEAANGEEAIAAVAAHKPGIVMMDLNMPGRDGLEISAELRAADPGLRICLVTANTQEAVRTRAGALGVAFLGKPIVAADLETLLASWAK